MSFFSPLFLLGGWLVWGDIGIWGLGLGFVGRERVGVGEGKEKGIGDRKKGYQEGVGYKRSVKHIILTFW